MVSTPRILCLVVALMAVGNTALAEEPLRDGLLADESGFAARPVSLKQGVVRLDLGPSDFAYMNSGELNNRRGVRVATGPAVGSGVFMGGGIAAGMTDNFEMGALFLPIRVEPNADYVDLEAYVRYAFSDCLAYQLTVLLPAETDVGLGLGFPFQLHLGDSARLDTGLEVELIFAEDLRPNLDVPLALIFNLGNVAFAGVQSGLFLSDFSDVVVDLGFQMGISVGDYSDLTASVNWASFVHTGAADTINGDSVEFVLGLTVYLDARDKDDLKDEKKAAARAAAAAAAQPPAGSAPDDDASEEQAG